MTKNRVTRFDETVAFIRGYAASGLPGPILFDIGTYVITQFPRLTPAHQTAFDALSTEMSVTAGVAARAARGTETQRAERRALVLLWRAMGATINVPNDVNARVAAAMTMAAAGVGPVLVETLIKAAVVASAAGATHVFNMEFSANPLGFIATRRIFIAGLTTGFEKLMDPAAPSYENFLNFRFQYQAGEDRFLFTTVPNVGNGASHTIHSISVPGLHWSDVPGRGLIPVPAVPGAPAPGAAPPPAPSFGGMLGVRFTGGPAWMFTSQFTGCAFCYKSGGGVLYAAHITPAGVAAKPVLDGLSLANQIMGNAPTVGAGTLANALGGGPPLRVFGNGAGNVMPFGGGAAFYPPKSPHDTPGLMKWMSIFGRFNGGWEIYTQSVDGALAIMEARRIV